MSSDLINLLIEEYEQYKITNCGQAEKNIKEFYKLIQQDLESSYVDIIYSYQYWGDSIYLEGVYVDKLDGRIKIINYLTRCLNKYKLINGLYIYNEKNINTPMIMTKEMYEKILNSSNNLN